MLSDIAIAVMAMVFESGTAAAQDYPTPSGQSAGNQRGVNYGRFCPPGQAKKPGRGKCGPLRRR